MRDPLAHVLTGVQAVPHLLVTQRERDRRNGMRTASFVSGYPGSPLAGLDMTIARFPGLAEHEIHLAPGLNEELAATAVWGSQLELPGRERTTDAVVGLWFAKSPGLDRAADAIRHANTMGAHPRGGVLALVGDDPACASSTLPSASERTIAALSMPVLYPRSSAEVISLGLYGIALSRLTGLWVGMKVVTSVAEGVGVVGDDAFEPTIVVPEVEWDGKPWSYVQGRIAMGPSALEAERGLLGPRWQALEAFVDANPLNVVQGAGPGAWLGIVAGGHHFDTVLQALADLGIDQGDLAQHGIRVLRLGVVHPLSRRATREFAAGLETVLVVEEKAPYLEPLVRDVLYGMPDAPMVVGERDREGQPLVGRGGAMTAAGVEGPLRRLLAGRVELPSRRERIPVMAAAAGSAPDIAQRGPYFCSGCPHNRSTVVPDGALVGLGIGCHAMAIVVPERQAGVTGITQMGGEGAQWIGQAPFNETPHIFQNMGDGTFAHSGQLAVQACVAAGVNVTFKILYNGAVAMTGAQEVHGGLSVADLTRKLHAEGVARIIVCAEEPERHRRDRKRFAPKVDVWPRTRLDEAQRILQDTPGVTVLVYDQMCAAEARRLRRRGQLPRRTKRVVINEEICEGCGDCGRKSNCLSVEPVLTELGRKTRIDQTSCNTDYSCLEGDCPSFVTVEVDAGPRPKAAHATPPEVPAPPRPVLDRTFNLFLNGVGGTGVITVNRVLAVAADLDGLHATGLDQLGSSQKAGAVTSHLRLNPPGAGEPVGNRVSSGSADAYLGFDVMAAAAPASLEHADTERTRAFVSTTPVPTGQMVYDTEQAFPDTGAMVGAIAASTRSVFTVDAAAASTALLGSREQANVLLLGAAYQGGGIPITAASIERALDLNGVAVEANVAAFRWGRLAVHDPEAFRQAVGDIDSGRRDDDLAERLLEGRPFTGEARALAGHRAARLVKYQSAKVARAYLDSLEEVWRAERAVTDRTDFTCAVARGLFHVTAYKDEYEVARLILDDGFRRQVARELPGAERLCYQLHPPVLRSLGMKRKIGFSPRWLPMFRVLAAGKVLRGTWADPFGKTAVRRLERRLAAEYATLVARLVDDLHDGYDRAIAAAEAVLSVRGYEHVKVEAYRRYTEALTSPIDSR